MPGYWHLTEFEEWACRQAYHIQVLSNTPCHLWLRWSNRHPWKHPRYREFRGLNIEGDVYYCFTAYHDVEQQEAGDTLEHTFVVTPWERFELRWFFFWGEVAATASPSMSPIFARYLDFSPGYLDTPVSHNNDVVQRTGNGIFCEPGIFPTQFYVGAPAVLPTPTGAAFRFRDCQLPRCAEILTAHLSFHQFGVNALMPVNTRLSAEDTDHALDFYSCTIPVLMARWAARTGIVDHNNLPPWTWCVNDETPSLITPVQNVVSRPGWAPGNSLVIFWEDFELRTPLAWFQFRVGDTYWLGSPYPVTLHTWYNHWTVGEVSAF